jgi:glutathione peroxidase
MRCLCITAAAASLAFACGSSERAEPLAGEPIADAARALIFDSPVRTLGGEPTSLAEYEGVALLLVNVASECGLTPQYEGLQALQDRYAARGFTVLGFPCNQFGNQEPGTPDEILDFCQTNYGVSFPIFEKIEVNGDARHPIYAGLTEHADENGDAGDIQWNFEKFLVSADRQRIYRFRPRTEPLDPVLVATLEAALP